MKEDLPGLGASFSSVGLFWLKERIRKACRSQLGLFRLKACLPFCSRHNALKLDGKSSAALKLKNWVGSPRLPLLLQLPPAGQIPNLKLDRPLAVYERSESGSQFVAVCGEVERAVKAGIACVEPLAGVVKVIAQYIVPNPPDNIQSTLPINFTEESETFCVQCKYLRPNLNKPKELTGHAIALTSSTQSGTKPRTIVRFRLERNHDFFEEIR